jgi:hypothetical protein
MFLFIKLMKHINNQSIHKKRYPLVFLVVIFMIYGCSQIAKINYIPAKINSVDGKGTQIQLNVTDRRYSRKFSQGIEGMSLVLEKSPSKIINEVFEKALSQNNYVLSPSANLIYNVEIRIFQVEWSAGFNIPVTATTALNIKITNLNNKTIAEREIMDDVRLIAGGGGLALPVASKAINQCLTSVVEKSIKDRVLMNALSTKNLKIEVGKRPNDRIVYNMKEALDKLAQHFDNIPKNIKSNKSIVIGVVNYHSQKRDSIANLIETELYLSMERMAPGSNLALISESRAGISFSSAIFLKGTYEQKGEIITLRVQALSDLMNGDLITQADIDFKADKTRKKSLVAILDIEAKILNEIQRKAFSELFRANFIQSKLLNITSSADVDKFNADAIQQTTGCTRDECATIIGEQLGVDRVISTTIFEVSKEILFISSKVINITDGTILASQSVEHNGDIQKLKTALDELSSKLIKQLK